MKIKIEPIHYVLSITIKTRKYSKHKWYLYLTNKLLGIETTKKRS